MRYEVREQEPTDFQRGMGVDHTVFVVWDTETGKSVPFGSYRSREQAERRIQRFLERNPEYDR